MAVLDLSKHYIVDQPGLADADGHGDEHPAGDLLYIGQRIYIGDANVVDISPVNL